MRGARKNDERNLILAAYAAAPPESDFYGSPEEEAFYSGLRALPQQGFALGGLEVPFNGKLHSHGVSRLADLLGEEMDLVITAMPGQMQMMANDPGFGLASSDANGRRRALEFFKSLARELSELQHLRPDLKIKAIEIHTGPRPSVSVQPSAEHLRASLRELGDESQFPADWMKLLVIEHCDEWTTAHSVAKGFLALEEEIAVAREFGLGMCINWGRSALEMRSSEGALRQIEELRRAGCLRGLIFSGAAVNHALYGDWEDSHPPFMEAMLNAADQEGLLLNREKAVQCLRAARSEVFLGLKMQALPRESGVPERLSFIERNLLVLQEAWAEACES